MQILRKEDIKQEFTRLTTVKGLSIDNAITMLFDVIDSDDHLLMGFNGIYVFMGTYKLEHASPDSWYPVTEVLLANDDEKADYKMFYELDTGLPKAIKLDELESFENNNTIIYIPNVRNYEDKHTFESDFKKLRKAYLKELCTKNEEEAVSLITTESFIKDLFSIERYLTENNISNVFYQAFYDAALCNKKDTPIVLRKSLH